MSAASEGRRREARALVRATRRAEGRVGPTGEGRERVLAAIAGVEDALARAVEDAELSAAMRHLEQVGEDVLGPIGRSARRELIEAAVIALAVALLVRGVVLEPFKIPSPSMVPTLLVGDRLLVNRLAYGLRLPLMARPLFRWSGPARGEVVVFPYPRDESKDYIKRVIAIEGDELRIDGREIRVNGRALERGEPTLTSYDDDAESEVDLEIAGTRRVVAFPERLGEASYTVFYTAEEVERSGFPHGPALPGLDCYPAVPTARPTCRVLPGYLFVMGDNRDNSADSRSFGAVLAERVRGRAGRIWWSRAERAGIRWERVGQRIE